MGDLVAVLVPVMRRPQNAAPFMESLLASTDDAVVYAVADIGDHATVDAWKASGAIVLAVAKPPGTFARKVNVGYRESYAPWLFLAGDDVRFHPGWLDTALAAAGDRFHVVGTNDLANARVMAGEHATHMLVRRTYVDEQGASWDGPGVVCHEGYRHWYVDNEIVLAAKQCGVWAMALGSVVEHLHPLFGTAPHDDVYELGQSWAGADAALFERRRATYAL
jgi:glycosyltransferase involved in cell wall biosynthesis